MIEELLIEKVKEKYIAKLILNSIDDYDIKKKYDRVLMEFSFTVFYHNEPCIFGNLHSSLIIFKKTQTERIKFISPHPYDEHKKLIIEKRITFNKSDNFYGYNFYDYKKI